MTSKDFPVFCQLWGQTYELFNRSLSDGAFNLAFNALADLTIEEVKQGISYTVRTSKFAPTVADIRSAIEQAKGKDACSLEQKANDMYNKLNTNVSIASDIVCDDARAVFAFKRAFGSLKEFGSHAISADAFDRKAFVEMYKNAKPEWYERDPEKNLIHGIYHYTNNPPVKFIGDKDTCKQICNLIYAEKCPRLPTERKVLQIRHDVKQTQTNQSVCNLDDVLRELKQLLSPSYKGE